MARATAVVLAPLELLHEDLGTLHEAQNLGRHLGAAHLRGTERQFPGTTDGEHVAEDDLTPDRKGRAIRGMPEVDLEFLSLHHAILPSAVHDDGIRVARAGQGSGRGNGGGHGSNSGRGPARLSAQHDERVPDRRHPVERGPQRPCGDRAFVAPRARPVQKDASAFLARSARPSGDCIASFANVANTSAFAASTAFTLAVRSSNIEASLPIGPPAA